MKQSFLRTRLRKFIMPALLALALFSLQISGIHHAYEHGLFSGKQVAVNDLQLKNSDPVRASHNCVMFDGAAQAFFAVSSGIQLALIPNQWAVPEFNSHSFIEREQAFAYLSRAPPYAI